MILLDLAKIIVFPPQVQNPGRCPQITVSAKPVLQL